jgi:hypothetical protein
MLNLHCRELVAMPQGRVRAHLSGRHGLQAGQVALWSPPTFDPYLPITLWPSQIEPDNLVVELPPAHVARPWLLPDSELQVVAPVGKPVLLAGNRILLVANAHPERLLPWTQQALAQNKDVVLLLGRPYPRECVPAAVEMRVGHLPSLLKEYSDWADELLIHTEPARQLLTYLQNWQFPCHVLFSPVLPCGVGACQACYLPSHPTPAQLGWLACQDGLSLPFSHIRPQDD